MKFAVQTQGGSKKNPICTCTHAVVCVAGCSCLGLARRTTRRPCDAVAAVEVKIADACCAVVGIVGRARIAGRSGTSIGAAASICCAFESDTACELRQVYDYYYYYYYYYY